MGLYLGSSQVKLIQNGVFCDIKLAEVTPVLEGIKLLSFDGYELKDKNGLYLTATKESE